MESKKGKTKQRVLHEHWERVRRLENKHNLWLRPYDLRARYKSVWGEVKKKEVLEIKSKDHNSYNKKQIMFNLRYCLSNHLFFTWKIVRCDWPKTQIVGKNLQSKREAKKDSTQIVSRKQKLYTLCYWYRMNTWGRKLPSLSSGTHQWAVTQAPGSTPERTKDWIPFTVALLTPWLRIGEGSGAPIKSFDP